METNTSGQTATSNAAVQDAGSGGNDQLSQAFDKAIGEAQKTLATTTIKGADLYALKQSVR
jgi:hypothetical protein